MIARTQRLFELFLLVGLTHLPLTLRLASESLRGDTRRFEIVAAGTVTVGGGAVIVGGGTVTVGGGTVIERVLLAAALALQYAVWPVNTNAVEQPASSVTVNVTV